MPAYPRIPFEEAVGEPLLFKTSWSKLSRAQKVVLKAIYGMELEKEDLLIWAALNGGAIFSDLGEVIGYSNFVPYIPEEKEDTTLILGRRWGKSDQISSFIVAYEALCGGHKEYVGRRQDPVILQVSQDLNTSKACLRQFILGHLESSPIGVKELGDLNKSVTADTIRLKTALITVGPPTIKLRGQAVATCCMDEVGVWQSDKDAAAPDMEVERAVRPAMTQFPFRKLVKTSTPWIEEGILWEAADRKARGELSPKEMVLRGPTLLSGNPHASVSYLRAERAKDAEAFRREFLAEFAKSVSGFLSPVLLRAAATPGLGQRPPEKGVSYVATMDPAFRRDAFAFCLGHVKGGEFILDFICQWSGTRESPLSPLMALQAIAKICQGYGIRSVVSDQYHLESLQELASSVGLLVEPSPITADLKGKMWGEVQGLLALGKLKLLDHPLLLDQMAKMEKRLTPGGTVQYQGGGSHDDLAMVLALCVHRALQMGEPALRAVEKPLVTHADQFWDLYRKRVAAGGNGVNQQEESPWYV